MTTQLKYARIQIVLHWGIFLLFAFNFIVSDGMGQALRTKLEGGTPEGFVAAIHPPIGIAVLVLALIRVIARFALGAPEPVESANPLMDKAASYTHLALYALLLLIPLSGIATWGLGIRAAGEVHEILINLTMVLVGLHAAAALYHQFILKDGLLMRMRPRG
ncbi:cytochrome b [Primorskyibacter sp. 2E233]|uniref:cytochrome b n=1 Tax=Primorskyibacter sp. 2E233 TaxID=3413431 RepID=UPI003BF09E9F